MIFEKIKVLYKYNITFKNYINGSFLREGRSLKKENLCLAKRKKCKAGKRKEKKEG